MEFFETKRVSIFRDPFSIQCLILFFVEYFLQQKTDDENADQSNIIEECGKIWILDNDVVINIVLTAQRKTEKAGIENQIQNQH